MDYDKLIEQYRQAADEWEKRHTVTDTFDLRVQDALRDAATAIETLWADLARVTAERDAAQALLAERSGVTGSAPLTTAFGVPLDRLRELVKADREGKIPKYTIGDTIYDRFGIAWEVTAVERCLLAGEPNWIYRCGRTGTNDYFALWEFEVLTRAEAEAALKAREQDGNNK